MKKYFFSVGFVLASTVLFAQDIRQYIDIAVKNLLNDVQMKHAMMGLYVIESKTGKIVYNLNEQTGLAAASTQKLFTSVAAFDLLGNNYRYQTEVGYDGKIENYILYGNLFIAGSGDPTFGSWRFTQTKRESVLNSIVLSLKNSGIKKIEGNIILDDSKFSYQPLPGGWIWDDIGNYYGAGTWGINWNENQYDLILAPGDKEGDDVKIIGEDPETAELSNVLKTGKKGSGDNGYIYLAPYSSLGFVNGTVPAGEKKFSISGSIPYPPKQFGKELSKKIADADIEFHGDLLGSSEDRIKGGSYHIDRKDISRKTLYIFSSPSLDSINYFFLQKSINLYGEALIKTMAYEKTGEGSTEKGVEVVKDFWTGHGIEKSAINILDGSGLSPQNRVTTDALVKALQYARTRPWFNSFYNALPVYNNMKMKSGTISGAKAFAGYQTSSAGMEYSFAIIINNFDGGANEIVQKIYKILNELK